jgi:hypothetical protein
MRCDLTGATLKLATLMSDVSEDVTAAGWLTGTEWTLWDALTEWRETGYAYWGAASIREYMPRLDELQRAAAGWIWWTDAHGPTYVPESRWLRIFAAHERQPILARWKGNAELDKQIPEEPTDV